MIQFTSHPKQEPEQSIVSPFDSAFETEEIWDEEDEEEAEEAAEIQDQQIQAFYDSMQNMAIEILVGKMRVLEPLLAASFQRLPAFMLFMISDANRLQNLNQFNQEFSGFLTPTPSERDREKGRINTSIRDRFILAWQHFGTSNGYPMTRFLQSHPMVFEYLQQNIDRLLPIQREYVAFCTPQFENRKIQSLKRSFAGLEVTVKKGRTSKSGLAASQ
jgi:hypothetical protein